MAGTLKVIGPQAMTATDAGDILASSALTRRLRQVRFANTAAAPATVSFGLGASFTAANSIINAKAIAANETQDHYFTPGVVFVSKAIRALASATTVSITISYEEDA